MKLFNVLILIFIIVFSLPRCGPTQEEYDRLSSRIAELESQLDECQNGASLRIDQIIDAFQIKNYKYTKQIRLKL